MEIVILIHGTVYATVLPTTAQNIFIV